MKLETDETMEVPLRNLPELPEGDYVGYLYGDDEREDLLIHLFKKAA